MSHVRPRRRSDEDSDPMSNFSERCVIENRINTYLKLFVYALHDCREKMVIIRLCYIVIEARSKVFCQRDLVDSNDVRVRPIFARSNVADIAKCLGREFL
jgi:hypothetical protein